MQLATWHNVPFSTGILFLFFIMNTTMIADATLMAKMAPTASTPPTTPNTTDWSRELEAAITDVVISDVKPVVKVCCRCVHCIQISSESYYVH